jgi:isoleucyl-tRNA synthetase
MQFNYRAPGMTAGAAINPSDPSQAGLWSALADPGERMRYLVKPRFKLLGPRLGGAMKAVAEALAALPPAAVLAGYREGSLSVSAQGKSFSLAREELDFLVEPLGNFAVGIEGALAGALDLTIDAALQREGQLRELVNRVQNLRKSAGLAVADRIRLRWEGGELTRATVAEHGGRLAEELLAVTVGEGLKGSGHREQYRLGEEEVTVELEPA